MSRIVEYVRQGLTSATIDWMIEEEDWDASNRTWTRTTYTTAPTRVVAHLTPVDERGEPTGGSVVTLDSQTLGLGPDQPFEWDATRNRLLLRWGNLVPDTLPTGRYRLDLDWYDADLSGGVRLGRPGQVRLIIVE